MEPTLTAADLGEPDPAAAIIVVGLNKAYRIWSDPAQRLVSPMLAEASRLLPGSLGRRTRERAQAGYRDFFALKDIAFEVKRGEAVGIIGRNGAGKSTLLQIIAGTLQPTSGGCRVNGRVAALLELGAGFNPEFTGRENVFLSGAVLGLGKAEVAARFDEIAAFADIGDFIEQPVKTYSSGMMMRLAFAVNTCVDPDILIVDEALSVGDAPFQAKCFRRLRQLIEKGVSLLFVSHDIGTVRSICSRALWLKNGRAELWGPAMEVAKEYEKFCWQEQGVAFAGPTPDLTLTAAVAPAGGPAPRTTSEIMPAAETAISSSLSAGPSATMPRGLLLPNPLFARARHSEHADRYGNGAVSIRNLICTNAHGEITSRFAFNEAITLHYLIRTNLAVDSDIVLGIRIKDTRDHYLYSVQDIARQHRISAPPGAEFHATTTFRLPLTHGSFLIKTGVFGFADGNSRIDGNYDFSRAVLWDIIEDGHVIEISTFPTMPLCGPVHAHADLHLAPRPASAE